MPTCVRSFSAPSRVSRARPKSATFTSPPAREHDVLRLDVAVHDAMLGRLRQRGRHLTHDRQRMGQIGRAVPGDVVAQVLPLHVLLGDVVQHVDAADFINLHDVGVHQRSRGLGFQLEPLEIRSDRRPNRA